MASSPPSHDEVRRIHPDPAALALFETLCKRSGVEYKPELVRQYSALESEDEWPVWIEGLAERMGLRVKEWHPEGNEGFPNELPGVGLARNQRGELAWLVVLERRDELARVRILGENREECWLDAKQLTAWQSSTEGGRLRWVVVDPLMPCEPTRVDEEHQHDYHSTRSLLSRLFGLFRQDRKDLVIVFWFALGAGIFSLATPITVEAIVATIQGGTMILLQPVLALSVVLLICLGLASFFRVMQSFVVEFLQQRLFVRVTADLAHRFPRVRAESFDQHHGPELVNRFFDVLTVQKAGATLLVDGLSVVIQSAVGLIVLAFYSPYLLGFDIVLIGALAFIVFVLGKGGIRTSIDESYSKYHVAGWLEEMVRHPQTFKAEGGADFAWAKADELARDYVRTRRTHFKVVFRQNLFSLILLAVSSAALFALGGWLVINRQLTLGQLVAAELLLAMVVGSFVKLGKSLESYYDLMAALDKLGHLIDLPLESTRGERLPAKDHPATLTATDLCFAYPEGTGKNVLDDLSFEIRPGERVGIVGPHGCGKSTLLDLIFGLRSPTSGRLELDGIDFREIHIDSLREHIASVKGAEVFEGTVLENVRVGRSSLSVEDVRTALEKLQLYDEIRELPDGLYSKLATGGLPLSYGQIRRLVKARAVAARPRLLLIDEGLDTLPKYLQDPIIDALTDPEASWTLVVVTHHPEVMRRMGRLISLSKTNTFSAYQEG